MKARLLNSGIITGLESGAKADGRDRALAGLNTILV